MKTIMLITALLFIGLLNINAATPDEVFQKIKWLGHSTIKINTGKLVIYIDPYKLKDADKADIILITHNHYDHYSKEDIKKLKKNGQVIVAPFKIDDKNIVLLPNKSTEVKGIKIETVPAYNITKKFHPKSDNNVGYIITIDGVRIYHAGDTELIPEMKDIKCDIAFIPLGQTYTMKSLKDAYTAALTIHPSIAVPIHWGDVEGSEDDAKKFVNEVIIRGVKAYLMKKE